MNRWLLRPRVMQAIALATFACIALFQLPFSPAAGAHFTVLAGAPPFDERPAGYTLSGVLAAFHALGAQGLRGYEAYRAVDVVFPWLLCGLVAAVMLRIGAARATMWPWLAAIADTIENALQYAMLLTRDDLSPELVQWASLATQAKFALYALMLVFLLAVGACALWRQQRDAR
ncbi:MAG: hypothetical protein ACJ8G1_05700 [Vitreoscilla sp.]